MLGLAAPIGIAGAAMKLPHHAGEKAAGPIGPQFAVVVPAAADGVDGKEIGVSFDQRCHLPFCELQRLRISGMPRGRRGGSGGGNGIFHNRQSAECRRRMQGFGETGDAILRARAVNNIMQSAAL